MVTARHVVLLVCSLGLLSCNKPAPLGERSMAVTDDVARRESDTESGAISTEPALADDVDENPRVEDPQDVDGDGATADVDPDDENPFVYLGAEEIPCSGVDEDGDGVDPCPEDRDGDGVRADRDCDDAAPFRQPFAVEIRCNGQDENCDDRDDCDRDGDGVLDRDDLDPDDPGVTTPPAEEPNLDPDPL